MGENYQSLEPQIHICPVCKKVSEWYAVSEINPKATCSEKCRKEQIKNGKKTRTTKN